MKKSGKCPILGRISVDGKNTAFGTGLEIFPADWDAGSGMATGKSDERNVINRQIESYRSKISEYYKNMLATKGFVTAQSLKNALQGLETNNHTVIQEFAVLLDEKKQSVGITVEQCTFDKYELSFRQFKDFLRFKYEVDDIPFDKVDLELVESLVRYMKINLSMAPVTVRARLKHFRTLVKRAFSRGWIRQNPFFEYVPEKIIDRRKRISIDELKRIMNVEIKRQTWSFTRDMFVFACFTGISFADLKNLKHSDIQQMKDGNPCISFKRQKTETDSFIPLLPIPEIILEKYRNSRFSGIDGKVFKLQTLTGMDWQLKRIAAAAEIDKRLTFHAGRHTFATEITLSKGVPIETISRMLGHKSISTTQIYAEITRTKLNEDMTKLAERIEGKYEPAKSDGKN